VEEPPEEPPEELPVDAAVEAVGAAAVGFDAGTEEPGAPGAELLEDEEEPQPAASPAARSATPVISPRWVRADSVIQ
jgi:hypothetical protein